MEWEGITNLILTSFRWVNNNDDDDNKAVKTVMTKMTKSITIKIMT